MSVLIKGMEMPKNCDECKIKSWDEGENDYVCPFSGVMTLSIGRQDDCPLEEQEPCEDAVSREAIESILYELYEVCTNMDELVYCMDDNLKKLPSVTPQRTGKWISHYVGIDEDDYGWDCSECGEWFVMEEPYHYCPKCGAKMQ